MTQTRLLMPRSVDAAIRAWADAAYPNEGCGLLVGRFLPGERKEVVRLAPLTNGLLGRMVTGAPTLPEERQGSGAGKTEFLMDPAEFNQVTLAAEKEGLDIVGVIHTHPDHPARPSKVDEAQPFLAQWSNIIVAVERGRTREMKSWFRDTDGKPFVEEPLDLI